MKLQAMRLPEPLHGAQADPDPIGARAVRCVTALSGSEQVSASTFAKIWVGCSGVSGGRVLSGSKPTARSFAKCCCRR
jgi:hypothetical protein